MNYRSLDSLMIIYNEDLSDLEAIIESAVDTLESSLFDMANEAEGNDSSSASEISSKYRSGFNKIKKGKRSKNNSLVSQGQREVNEASRELQEAEKNAKTPEEKKKLSTVAKIAIGVGAAALVGLLAYVGVKNRGKFTNSLSRLKKNSGTSVNGAVQNVNNVVQTIVNTPVQDTPQVSPEEKIKIQNAIMQQQDEEMKKAVNDLEETVKKGNEVINQRHREAAKIINASLAKIYSDDDDDEVGRPKPNTQLMTENDRLLNELLKDL